MEIKQIRILNKLFRENTNEDKPIPKKDYKAYMDAANLFAVIPKTRKTEDTLKAIFDVSNNSNGHKLLNDLEKNNTAKSTYSVEYIKLIYEFLKMGIDNNVTFSMGNDMPFLVETKEMYFILAPKVRE